MRNHDPTFVCCPEDGDIRVHALNMERLQKCGALKSCAYCPRGYAGRDILVEHEYNLHICSHPPHLLTL